MNWLAYNQKRILQEGHEGNLLLWNGYQIYYNWLEKKQQKKNHNWPGSDTQKRQGWGGLPIGIKDIKRGARKVVISSKMKYTYKLYWIEVGWKEEVDVLKTWQDHQQDEVEYENEE